MTSLQYSSVVICGANGSTQKKRDRCAGIALVGIDDARHSLVGSDVRPRFAEGYIHTLRLRVIGFMSQKIIGSYRNLFPGHKTKFQRATCTFISGRALLIVSINVCVCVCVCVCIY